ncbi:hypothetical protein NBRC116592_30330 [Colwellia sp. KU-HH00111]|uniref:DUF2059 domain-containing protein n=1 Tax=Colwellia sp. KU-HH00111 TaxID=3127652 RepID=UPI00310AE11D
MHSAIAEDSNSSDSRTYAKKIFKLSSENINLDNLVTSFVSGGYSEEESTKFAKIFIARLKSGEYVKLIEDIYIEEFTVEELKQLSEILEYPVFNKFLNKRLVINGKMMKVLNTVPSQNDG